MRLRGKHRRRRAPLQQWPASIERDYFRGIMAAVDGVQGLVRAHVIPELGLILAEAAALRPERARADAWGDVVARIMAIVRGLTVQLVQNRDLEALASRIAAAVSNGSKANVHKAMKAALGVDVLMSEPWLEAELRAFVSQNVALIKDLTERQIAAVERIVYDGARRGAIKEGLAAELLAVPIDRSERGALFIARDQISKFNGALAQLRQRQLGIARYVWRTSRDARVRDDHRVREGHTFDWAHPPFDGHPGQPVNCRCYAEPVIEDLFAEEEPA